MNRVLKKKTNQIKGEETRAKLECTTVYYKLEIVSAADTRNEKRVERRRFARVTCETR